MLLSNVVLSGGGSLFAGLADRLMNELSRNFSHVCFDSLPPIHSNNIPSSWPFDGGTRLRYTRREIPRSVGLVDGWAGAFLRA